jgi:hypothetical protein
MPWRFTMSYYGKFIIAAALFLSCYSLAGATDTSTPPSCALIVVQDGKHICFKDEKIKNEFVDKVLGGRQHLDGGTDGGTGDCQRGCCCYEAGTMRCLACCPGTCN